VAWVGGGKGDEERGRPAEEFVLSLEVTVVGPLEGVFDHQNLSLFVLNVLLRLLLPFLELLLLLVVLVPCLLELLLLPGYRN
jgi:hypothetical protein